MYVRIRMSSSTAIVHGMDGILVAHPIVIQEIQHVVMATTHICKHNRITMLPCKMAAIMMQEVC